MKYKVEDPFGHLLFPLIFRLGYLKNIPCKHIILDIRWSTMIAPDIVMAPVPCDQSANYGHCGGELGTREICPNRKSPVVALTNFRQDTQSRVPDGEVKKATVEAESGRCCESLQRFCTGYPLIADADATEEKIERVHNNGGIKDGKLREVVHDRIVNRFIPGDVEYPRYLPWSDRWTAPQVAYPVRYKSSGSGIVCALRWLRWSRRWRKPVRRTVSIAAEAKEYDDGGSKKRGNTCHSRRVLTTFVIVGR